MGKLDLSGLFVMAFFHSSVFVSNLYIQLALLLDTRSQQSMFHTSPHTCETAHCTPEVADRIAEP